MLKVKVDTSLFERTLKEYMDYTSRDFVTACNTHAYYIARNAVAVTTGADREVIAAKLSGPATRYPNVPLAAILVNVERAKKNKKGLSGQKMANAQVRLTRKFQSHVNFVRSGFLAAIDRLNTFVPRKKGSTPRIPARTRKKGRNFGGAKPATPGFSPTAWIWTTIRGSKDTAKVRRILEEGAIKSVEMERQSMIEYIKKKQAAAIAKTFGTPTST